MYFSESKPRPLGSRLEGGKLAKKTQKAIAQLKRHDPDVVVSSLPTQHVLVANSGVLCEVSLEELEETFYPFGSPQLTVFPHKRSYSFASFSSVSEAEKAFKALNGVVPAHLRISHLPFILLFVEKVPSSGEANAGAAPNDLRVLEEFISVEEENELIRFTESSSSNVTSLKNRTVFHFGHSFDYDSNSAFVPCEPLPSVIQKVADKILDYGIATVPFDQVTVNVYDEGQGIPFHFDTHSAFEDPVVSLSLNSDVLMEFKDAANPSRLLGVLLRRRSLCVIEGESRYRWKHGIVSRHHDVLPSTGTLIRRGHRISITFRKPCQCAFPELCDWDRGGKMAIPSDDAHARAIEANYVADVYESIADHFNETRRSQWKAVDEFLCSLPPFSAVLDLGCGNGKYLTSREHLLKIGCDRCGALCEVARKKGGEVLRADALHTPFRDEAFDAIICVAVLHHLATEERRGRLLREIERLLRPGGSACVTVWAMDQEGSEYRKTRQRKEERERRREQSRLAVHDSKDFVQQDVLVPWTDGEETRLRFYHVFEEGELDSAVRALRLCSLVSMSHEQGNWVAVFRRNP